MASDLLWSAVFELYLHKTYAVMWATCCDFPIMPVSDWIQYAKIACTHRQTEMQVSDCAETITLICILQGFLSYFDFCFLIAKRKGLCECWGLECLLQNAVNNRRALFMLSFSPPSPACRLCMTTNMEVPQTTTSLQVKTRLHSRTMIRWDSLQFWELVI